MYPYYSLTSPHTHTRHSNCVEQTNGPASWEQWVSTEVDACEKNGGTLHRDVFRKVSGTRKQLLDRIFELAPKFLYHMWVHQMTKHQGELRVATFDGKKVILVKCDFAASIELKAKNQGCCEWGPHTNMFVVLVLHSPGETEVGCERHVVCDTWRVFTNSKPSAMVHQYVIQKITRHYKEKIPGLTDIFLETDGSSSQFKGESSFCVFAFQI